MPPPAHSQSERPLVPTLDLFLATHVHAVNNADLTDSDAHECSICWNTFGETQYEDEKLEGAVRIDPCGHVFGKLCLEKHLRCNPQGAKCPTCRRDLYGLSLKAQRALLERGPGEGGARNVLRRRVGELTETARKRRAPAMAPRTSPIARRLRADSSPAPTVAIPYLVPAGPTTPVNNTGSSDQDQPAAVEHLRRLRQEMTEDRNLFTAPVAPRLPADRRAGMESDSYEMEEGWFRRVMTRWGRLGEGEEQAAEAEGDA